LKTIALVGNGNDPKEAKEVFIEVDISTFSSVMFFVKNLKSKDGKF